MYTQTNVVINDKKGNIQRWELGEEMRVRPDPGWKFWDGRDRLDWSERSNCQQGRCLRPSVGILRLSGYQPRFLPSPKSIHAFHFQHLSNEFYQLFDKLNLRMIILFMNFS